MNKLIGQFNAATDDAERKKVARKIKEHMQKYPMSACLVNVSVLADILILAE